MKMTTWLTLCGVLALILSPILLLTAPNAVAGFTVASLSFLISVVSFAGSTVIDRLDTLIGPTPEPAKKPVDRSREPVQI
jgi:hypothetical protein